MKTCARCGQVKARDEFYKRSAAADGLRRECKPCVLEMNRIRARQRRREDEAWRLAQNEACAAYRARSPEIVRAQSDREREERKTPGTRVWARRRLYYALRSNAIVKPDACDECGMHCERRELQGHHADYAAPLDVEWLCSLCHGRRHWQEQAA